MNRLIARGQLKAALKQAQHYLSQQKSPENRQLVEQTYLLRIEELIRIGMQDSAADVARSFLEFGATQPASQEALIALLPRLGMSSQAAALKALLDTTETTAGVTPKLADLAVLHPHLAPAEIPDLRAGAERIRAALGAIERSSEAEALDLLKEIPRNSPWADWRLFVRGLAAYYRRDDVQAAENWGRLATDRPAHRIATVLLQAAGQSLPGGESASAASKPSEASDLSLLEVAVYGEPVLARLAELKLLLTRPTSKAIDWQKVCQLLAPLRLALRSVDPRWAQRLTEILLGPLEKTAISGTLAQAQKLIPRFTSAAEPLPLDPKWNRFWAILWEKTESDFHEAISCWQKYLHDIERITSLTPEEQRRLQALVWRHIGLLRSHGGANDLPAALAMFTGSGPAPRQPGPAIKALEQSLQLDPTQRKTYELLLELHEENKQPAAAAQVAARCLEAFPDDMDALRLLIEHHRRQDEPEAMLRYVERAQTVQRLDAKLTADELWARVGLARRLALGGKFALAREELARAKALFPSVPLGFRTLARHAALEFKAGDADRAEQYVQEARGKLDEPTALWLALHIESVRYELAPRLRRQYQDAWRAALTKRTTSQTAGAITEMLVAFLMAGIEYTGRAQHIKEVVQYLGRTTRIKYREADLRSVCAFLQFLEEEELLGKLVKKGLKQFPKSPVYHYMAAQMETLKGPFECDVYAAKKHVQAALKFAEASTEHADQELIPDLKRCLIGLDDMAGKMPQFPPFGGRGGRQGRGGPGMKEILDVIRQMMGMAGQRDDDDEDDFDDDDGMDFFFGGPPSRRPARPRRKRK